MDEVTNNALEIYFKSHIKQPDIHIKFDQIEVVRVTVRESYGYLQCIDKDDNIHCYNLDDIHAFHVDTRKVRYYEAKDI